MYKILLLVVLLCGCAGKVDPNDRAYSVNEPHINLMKHQGKTVAAINVYKSGREIVISFTDGTSLTLRSYKYAMKAKH